MILLLKLNDGTELIADVSENTESAYVCSDILEIITDRSDDKQSIGLVPFMPYADPTAGIAIPLGMAILTVPGERLKEHYNKIFSKIIVPESRIVTA
jgi:hypothetical protein